MRKQWPDVHGEPEKLRERMREDLAFRRRMREIAECGEGDLQIAYTMLVEKTPSLA